jgi:hypothetical protein
MVTSPLTDEQKKGPKWFYYQRNGILCQIVDMNGVMTTFQKGYGYSGFKNGKNNPKMQTVHDVGPIPRGFWHIGHAHDSLHTGPVTMDLLPYPGTETFGRDLFRIHGDSKSDPGNASHGCIILSRPLREIISNSNIHILEVA